MSVEPLNGRAVPASFARWLELGFRLIPYPRKLKGPEGPEGKGWQRLVVDRADQYIPDSNWGVLTGAEIQPGKFLVDVDYDYAEGLPMAKTFFPNMSYGWGRKSRLISHSLATTSEPVKSKAFKDPVTKKTLVEIRGTKANGDLGLQSMLPTSIHPNGEVIELRMDQGIPHDDQIVNTVRNYAIACLLHIHLGERGLGHDTRLAVAGFLLQSNLSVEEVITIGEAIAEMTGNDASDVRTTVLSTASRLKAKERVHGKGQLAKALGQHGLEILKVIRDWLGGGDFITDKSGRPLANNPQNIRLGLAKLDITARFDLFALRPTMTENGIERDITDDTCLPLWFRFHEEFGFQPTKEYFFDVLKDLALRSSFHPVKDYLDGLTWDGIPRIERWLIDAAQAAESEFVKAVSSLVLVAAVRRIRKPGAKFDELLVLESGTQGKLKSSAVQALCPHEDWFSDQLPLGVDAKQVIERTAGKWILEAPELSGLSPSKIERVKVFLSSQTDGPVRMAYDRLPKKQPRQFIVFGTTNSYSYLSDPTGNRRFWPVRVDTFNLDWIREHRDQLWAEAAQREAEGASIRLPEHLWEHAALQQERRRTDDPWESLLRAHFDEDYQRVAPDEVFEVVGVPRERQDRKAMQRVSDIMQLLEFKRVSVRPRGGGKPIWGWGRGTRQHSGGQGRLPEDEGDGT